MAKNKNKSTAVVRVQGQEVTVHNQGDTQWMNLTELQDKYGTHPNGSEPTEKQIYRWIKLLTTVEHLANVEARYNTGFNANPIAVWEGAWSYWRDKITVSKWIMETNAKLIRLERYKKGHIVYAHREIALHYLRWANKDAGAELDRVFLALGDEKVRRQQQVKFPWQLSESDTALRAVPPIKFGNSRLWVYPI